MHMHITVHFSLLPYMKQVTLEKAPQFQGLAFISSFSEVHPSEVFRAERITQPVGLDRWLASLSKSAFF